MGSIPITRSRIRKRGSADVAQLVEHVLGKDEVTGSIPVVSSSFFGPGAVARSAQGLDSCRGLTDDTVAVES